MPILIYHRCKKHETQLKVTKNIQHLQVFYNGRQIAVFSRHDIINLMYGDIKKPKLVKECEDEKES